MALLGSHASEPRIVSLLASLGPGERRGTPQSGGKIEAFPSFGLEFGLDDRGYFQAVGFFARREPGRPDFPDRLPYGLELGVSREEVHAKWGRPLHRTGDGLWEEYEEPDVRRAVRYRRTATGRDAISSVWVGLGRRHPRFKEPLAGLVSPSWWLEAP